MLEEIIGDLSVVSNNHKFPRKFHSGTLRIVDTMRLMSLFFQLMLKHLLEFVLNCNFTSFPVWINVSIKSNFITHEI